jgi:hypothetical protein
MSENQAGGEANSANGLAARIAVLERENAELRVRAASAGAGSTGTTAPARVRRHRGRAVASTVLILLGVLLAPVAVVASWAERTLTDTDSYMATIAPLASDPVIQSAVANRLTQIVMERADVPTLVDDAVTALSANESLPPRAALALGALEEPVTSGIESFIHRVAERVVESDAFETAWVEANRLAHEQLVTVMEGGDGETLQVGGDGQLTIQLAGVIEALKERLVAGGFSVAANIPEVNASFTLVQTTQLVRVQNSYNTLTVLGTWLPWLSLGLIAAGVLTARRRSRALVVAGLGLAVAMLVLGLGLYFGRTFYLGALSGQVERLDAAEIVFDQLVAYLRVALRTVAVLGLVVAAVAYFAGGSDSARSMRAEVTRGFASSRNWAEKRGVTTGPVGTWLEAHKTFVRAVIVSLAGLVIVLAPAPTPAVVVTTALLAVLLVAIVELAARPAPVSPSASLAPPLRPIEPR